MSNEELIKKLCTWMKEHKWTESALLYPEPRTNIDLADLLDYINELTGITKEQLGEWINDN